MRITVMSGMCAAFLNIGAATAMPENMKVDRLLAICEAPDVQAATVQGGKLGWQRENAGQTDSLSFWLALGPNGHKACTYSTARPAGLLDALSARLGPPDTLDKEDAIEMISAYWKQGAVAYSFTQIGSSATIAVGPSR